MAGSVSKKERYRVLTGISWYGGKRAEVGEIRSDIPKASIPWLLDREHIQVYDPEAEKEAKRLLDAAEAKTGPGAADAPAGSGDTTEPAPVDAEGQEG